MSSGTSSTSRLVLTIVVAVGILAVKGFSFPDNNNQFHIPIVLDYLASEEGPHDAYTASLGNFVSAFWLVLKTFVTESSIYPVFLILFTLTIAAITALYLALITEDGWQMRTDRWRLAGAAALLCLPLMHGYSILGMNELILNYLTHSQVVVPFALLALLLLVRNRPIMAAAAIGVAFNINAFIGFWMSLIAGVAMLAVDAQRPLRERVRTAFAMAAIFLLLSAPTLVWILSAQANAPDYPAFDYIAFLRDYWPFHNLIDSQPQNALAGVLLVLWMWGTLIAATRSAKRELAVTLTAVAGCLTAILAFGAVLPYVTDSRLLLNLYPLRMDSLAIWLVAICTGTLMLSADGGNGNQQQRIGPDRTDDSQDRSIAPNTGAVGTGQGFDLHAGLWAAFLNGNVLLSLFLLRDRDVRLRGLGGLLMGAAAIAAVMIIGPEIRKTWAIEGIVPISRFFIAAACLQCILLGLSAARSRRGLVLFAVAPLAWAPLLFDAGTPAVTWIALVMLALAVASAFRPGLAPISAAAGLLLPGVMLAASWNAAGAVAALVAQGLFWAGWISNRLIERVPVLGLTAVRLPALSLLAWVMLGIVLTIGRNGLAAVSPESRALAEAQAWARSSTPPDTVFLPLGIDGFSTLSRRPIWVDWKQGAVVMWAPELYETWTRRHAETRKIRQLARALDYASRNGVEYIVAPIGRMHDKDKYAELIVFRNAHYLIIRVPG